MLRIDKREPQNMIKKIVKIAKEMGLDYEVTTTPVGDYVWDDYIVIERKTVPDFINSIRSGHLETQLLDMEQFEHAFLFISGRFENIKFIPYIKNWTVNHTIGSLCSIAARYNVKVLQFANDMQIAKAIFKIKEKVDKGKKVEAVKRHSKTLNYVKPSFALYMNIPGIGEKTAAKLVEIYPSFFDFLKDYKEEKLKIRINKKAKKFLDAL